MECQKISKYIKCKYSHKRIKSQRLLNCIRVYIYIYILYNRGTSNIKAKTITKEIQRGNYIMKMSHSQKRHSNSNCIFTYQKKLQNTRSQTDSSFKRRQ